MSANLEAKKLLVEEIKEKFSKAKTIAFVDICFVILLQPHSKQQQARV